MNALMPRFFLMFLRIDPWRIPQQRASHPLFLFFLFRYFSQKQRKTYRADIYYILF